jgi:hypothetical protein
LAKRHQEVAENLKDKPYTLISIGLTAPEKLETLEKARWRGPGNELLIGCMLSLEVANRCQTHSANTKCLTLRLLDVDV